VNVKIKVNVKVKVNFSLCLLFLTEHITMKSYWCSGGIASHIPRPRHCMEVSGQLHVPAALPPRKQPLVPIG
jgi:hypothetical protein